MPESPTKKLAGGPRLVVADEAPAGRFPFDPSNAYVLTMHRCEEPFISEREPLNAWRRLV